MPSKHLSTVIREEEIFLYALLKGYKINVGKIIEKYITIIYEMIKIIDNKLNCS